VPNRTVRFNSSQESGDDFHLHQSEMAMQMDSADCRIGELMLTMKKMSTNMSISKDGTWEQMRKKLSSCRICRISAIPELYLMCNDLKNMLSSNVYDNCFPFR
jgi:hypothetical protein